MLSKRNAIKPVRTCMWRQAVLEESQCIYVCVNEEKALILGLKGSFLPSGFNDIPFVDISYCEVFFSNLITKLITKLVV